MYNPYNPKNRLITRKDVEEILGRAGVSVKIGHAKIYQNAMIHSSYVKREVYTLPTGEETQLVDRPHDCLELFEQSYERLEHMGDSLLGAAVSAYLYRRFPSEDEGFLTNLKKEIVCNERLSELSKILDLKRFYIISRYNEDNCNGRENSKKLGDILEAFIGALWLDLRDFGVVYNFVIGLVERYIDIPKILMNNRNYKEQLQKIYQGKYHYTPTYKMVGSELGSYTMIVMDKDGKQLGCGTSNTKKQAEQLAAKQALLTSVDSANL